MTRGRRRSLVRRPGRGAPTLTPLRKRWLGLALVIVSAASLLIGAAAIVAAWSIRGPLTGNLIATLDLASDALMTTEDALATADDGLAAADRSLADVRAMTALSRTTLGDTRTALERMATLTRTDIPQSLAAARTALASAQASARLVDRVLGGLASVPLVNLDYRPDVPLGDAIGQVNASIEKLPTNIAAIGSSLDEITANLAEADRSLSRLQREVAPLGPTLEQARALAGRYRTQTARLREQLDTARATIPWATTLAAVGVTFTTLWLAAVQVAVLRAGLAWWRAGRGL
jgi:hypothetical protein